MTSFGIPRHPVGCTSPLTSISHVVALSSGRVLRATIELQPGNSVRRMKNSAHPPDVLPLPHPPQKARYLALRLWNLACFRLGSYGISTLRVLVTLVLDAG